MSNSKLFHLSCYKWGKLNKRHVFMVCLNYSFRKICIHSNAKAANTRWYIRKLKRKWDKRYCIRSIRNEALEMKRGECFFYSHLCRIMQIIKQKWKNAEDAFVCCCHWHLLNDVYAENSTYENYDWNSVIECERLECLVWRAPSSLSTLLITLLIDIWHFYVIELTFLTWNKYHTCWLNFNCETLL